MIAKDTNTLIMIGFILVSMSIGDDSLNISSLSGSSLRFSHTLPQPVYYTCERGGSTEQFNITEQGYNLTGLQPDTKYTIDCVAYLNGVDYCLEVNTSARTGGLCLNSFHAVCMYSL